MGEINPAEEKSLLKAILCTKLTGKAISFKQETSDPLRKKARNRNVLFSQTKHYAYTARI